MANYSTGEVNDILAPKNFIVPIVSGAIVVSSLPTGFLYISGGKLNFFNGAAVEVVTSV